MARRPPALPAGARHFLRIRRRSVAGRGRSSLKLVNPNISPITVSLIMVFGVLPGPLERSRLHSRTSHVRNDLRQAPHLIVWAVLAGCMWPSPTRSPFTPSARRPQPSRFAVEHQQPARHLLGLAALSTNCTNAGGMRWLGVLGGAVFMFAGATLLAIASSHQAPPGKAALDLRSPGRRHALGNDVHSLPQSVSHRHESAVLHYILHRRRTRHDDDTRIAYRGADTALARTGRRSRHSVLADAGRLVWVLGDLFQQYATKYVGISRGIPLSNTNQLWGLLWYPVFSRAPRRPPIYFMCRSPEDRYSWPWVQSQSPYRRRARREHSSWRDAPTAKANAMESKTNMSAPAWRAGAMSVEGESLSASRGGRTLAGIGCSFWSRPACFSVLALIAKLPHIEHRLWLGHRAYRRHARSAGNLRNRALAHHPVSLKQRPPKCDDWCKKWGSGAKSVVILQENVTMVQSEKNDWYQGIAFGAALSRESFSRAILAWAQR